MCSVVRLDIFLKTILIFTVIPALQGQRQITGILINDQQEGLPYVNIVLLHNEDSSIIGSAISDTDGAFQLQEVPASNYLVALSAIGYEKRILPARLDNDQTSLSLGTITMEHAVEELDEVTVTAEKPLIELQSDRLVVNVQSSVSASSLTALEMVEQSPGILVDKFNNQIGLNGKQGTRIMINGRISQMPVDAILQMLSSMPAKNIERIEILTNPPAKYEAEGDAGFLNIVLLKSQNKGVNGSVSLITGYGIKEKAGANAGVNIRSDNINVFTDYSFYYDNTYQTFINSRTFNYFDTTFTNSSVSERDPTVITHHLTTGIDLSLSPKTILGFLLQGSYRDWQQVAVSKGEFGKDPGEDTHFISNRTETNRSFQYVINLNLQHQFSENQMLNVDLDYFDFYQQQPQEYLNFYFNSNDVQLGEQQIRIDKTTPLNGYAARLDYSFSPAPAFSFETGVKLAYSSFNNNVKTVETGTQSTVNDNSHDENATMDEQIAATYISFNASPGDQIEFQGGLRYEYSYTDLVMEQEEIIEREYNSLFPNLSVSWNILKDHTLNASAGRRITRPSFSDLAPFILYMDPYTLLTGNTGLKPAFTTNYRASYMYKRFLISVEYSRSLNSIAGIQPTNNPETNQTIYSAVNLDLAQNYTLSSNFPLKITKWWEMRNDVSGGRSFLESDYDNSAINYENWFAYLKTTQTFKLPWKLAMELIGTYLSPRRFGASTMEMTYRLDFVMNKEFPKHDGELALYISDIFNSYRPISFYTSYPELHIDNYASAIIEYRVIRITYTKKFGNKKLKGHRQRITGSEEERSRL